MSTTINCAICFAIAFAAWRTYREVAPLGLDYLEDQRPKSYVAIGALVATVFGGSGTLYNGLMALGVIS